MLFTYRICSVQASNDPEQSISWHCHENKNATQVWDKLLQNLLFFCYCCWFPFSYMWKPLRKACLLLLSFCCQLNNNQANMIRVCDCWSLNRLSEYWIYDFEIKLYINLVRTKFDSLITTLWQGYTYLLHVVVFFLVLARWLWHGCDKHVHNPVTIISQPCWQSCSILVQAWQYYQLSMSKLPRLWETPTLVQCCNWSMYWRLSRQPQPVLDTVFP